MGFFDKLRGKAQAAAVNVMDAADNVADKIGDAAENLEEKFEAAVDKVEEKVEAAGDKLEATMDAAGENLMDKVEDGLKGETAEEEEEVDDPSIACIK